MTIDEFIDAVEALFTPDYDAATVLEVRGITDVAGVGVVGVTMYVREPWTYTSGELVLLRPGEEPDGVVERLREKVAALASPQVALEACTVPAAGYLGLDAPGSYPEGPVTDEVRARRSAALARSLGRFEAVAAKMKEVYGFKLPRHLAVFDAFMNSLSSLEQCALEMLGRRAGGIMVWFEEGGTDREPRDGLDARLDCRFRCDPAEMVTVMWGDSDGLHFGLWYDDPGELPSFVAANYARDSAETAACGATPLQTLLSDIEELFEWGDVESEFSMGALRTALRDFLEPEEAALARDGAPRFADAPHPELLGGIGCALPDGAGDPRGGGRALSERSDAYRARSPLVEDWVAEARRELADGQPAFAMTLGRELWWLDADEYRELSRDLLVAAYEALGRQEHADIIRLHHEHRDLPSVAVY